ncbi:hypothetical protein [Kitasatospora sp. NPDC088134]|uniref:hypothetical protein n=1 Tax=Kitasatospora sp. NPDC088134 TaxID=3364071 RepID=UPI00380B4310
MSHIRPDKFNDYDPQQRTRLTRAASDGGTVIAAIMPQLPVGTCGPKLINFNFQLTGVRVEVAPEMKPEVREIVADMLASGFKYYGWSMSTEDERTMRFYHPAEMV